MTDLEVMSEGKCPHCGAVTIYGGWLCGTQDSGRRGRQCYATEIRRLPSDLAKSRDAAEQLMQMVNSRQLALNMAIGEREQAKEAAMELYGTLVEEDDKRLFIEQWDWLEDGEL